MKKLLVVLCSVGLLAFSLVHAVEHEWTNKQGKTIQAEFVSAGDETVTISMGGKSYVVQLADLTPQSRALAAKLRVQKSKAQEPALKVVIDDQKLERRDRLRYFEGKPFTGIAVRKFPDGQKKMEVTFKDGKLHGLSTNWHENGQKWMEGTFNDGKQHGLYTKWHANGQERLEATWKDGEFISAKEWDKDGNPMVDYDQLEERDDLMYFKKKPFTGVSVKKYPNGQKNWENTWKDGKMHGLVTLWYENGLKSSENTWKDGVFISRKAWDEDGKLK